MKKIKIKDTYEASYYIMYGALIEKVEERKLPENKALKKGFRTEFYFTLINVPSWAKETYKSGLAFGNINDYITTRKRLKQYLKRYMLK